MNEIASIGRVGQSEFGESPPERAPSPRRCKVAVVGGNRIPFARSNSVYSHASNQDMLTAALDGLIDRYGLQGEALGEVAGGAVLKHSRDRDLTRESVLSTRLAAVARSSVLNGFCRNAEVGWSWPRRITSSSV